MGWRDHLKIHPLAAIFPPLSADELAALAADIARRGQLYPVVRTIDGSTVIAGVNRLDACALAGIEPIFADRIATDAEARAEINAENLLRRHMSKGQQAMAFAMLYPKPEKGGPGKKAQYSPETGGFGRQRLSDARMVLRHSEEMAQLVLSGALSLDQALAEIKEWFEPRDDGEIADNDRAEASGRKARGRKPGASAPKTEPAFEPPQQHSEYSGVAIIGDHSMEDIDAPPPNFEPRVIKYLMGAIAPTVSHYPCEPEPARPDIPVIEGIAARQRELIAEAMKETPFDEWPRLFWRLHEEIDDMAWEHPDDLHMESGRAMTAQSAETPQNRELRRSANGSLSHADPPGPDDRDGHIG